MRKKVLLPIPMLDPEGERVLSQEVDLIYGLEEMPPGRRLDLITSDQARHMAEVIEASLPEVHGMTFDFGATPDIWKKAPKLEVFASPGSGVDGIDLEAATAAGVAIVHAAGAGYIAVAEHAVGLMLALAKKIALLDRKFHRDKRWPVEWGSLATVGTVLDGKALGIVGFGYIGREIARKCQSAFNMRVFAYDPRYDPLEAGRLGVQLISDLEDLVSRVDFLSINCPHTPETRCLIGERVLKAMKPTAYIVNCARGAIIDEEALVRALQEGWIAGAGIDSLYPEGGRDNHPIYDLENVVLTPHTAGRSAEMWPMLARVTAEAMLAVLRGEKSHQVVNPEVWPKLQERQTKERRGA